MISVRVVFNELRWELKVGFGVKEKMKTVISVRMVLNESRLELKIRFGVKKNENCDLNQNGVERVKR